VQSEWVMTELRKARKAGRQSPKRKFFPARLVAFATSELGNLLEVEKSRAA
jgi:hypothetical protein